MAKREFRTLIFLSIAVVAMVLLSAGLSRLEFLPARPFPWWGMPLVSDVGEWVVGGGDIFMTVFRAFFVLSLVLSPLAIVYFIISPQARKRALRELSGFLTLAIVLYLLMRLMRRAVTAEMNPSAAPLAPFEGTAESAAEFAAVPPRWLVLVVSLGLALVIVGAMAGVVWLIASRRRPTTALQQLARKAQDALDALQAGADFKNTVIRCYFEMSRVVREQRGLTRQAAMTPHEFEIELEQAGLPADPIRQLTRLFEDVRYGDKTPSKSEGQQAIMCLQAIVEAARS